MKCDYEYDNPDSSILYNDSDGGLKPIRLSIPKPPDYKLIEGYGLEPEKQRFKRLETPFKLVSLERRIREEVYAYESSKRTSVTTFKLQRKFWEEIDNNQEYYSDEITWIKKVWWHRLNGYWFFNNGKPTYITGWHFDYLNFWHIPDILPDGYPNYRDRDRKEFIFDNYAFTTRETFKNIDKNGNAIKGENGKYEMIEMSNRICYGIHQAKNRRCGRTNRGMSIIHSIASMTIGTDGVGIMSYSKDNGKAHFKEKLVPAWRKFPMCLRPFTPSSNDPNSIVYDTPRNEYDAEGLQTKITYAETAEATFYNGQKLVGSLCDEEGQTPLNVVNVVERWGVLQHCHAQGDGRIIFGFSIHPSTVDEYTEGGIAYSVMGQQSDFYKRKPDGQTQSGLFRLFTSATEGLDDFIDSYGYSVVKDPSEYQIKEGFTIGSEKYLQDSRDFYLMQKTPDSSAKYRKELKLFPIKYSDCWLGNSGDIGWNIQIIDGAIAECRVNNETTPGNFEWVSEKFGPVYFDPQENGRWLVSDLMDSTKRNRMQKVEIFDPFDNVLKPMWSPITMPYDDGIVGADPYRFLHKRDHQISGYKHKMSEGGICVVRDKDPDLDGNTPSNYVKYGVIATYRHRLDPDDLFVEDVLKTCIYYNMLCYPETNVETVWKKFIEWGFGGYLLSDVDETGRRKHRPGVFNLENSKQNGLLLIKNYVDIHGHRLKHMNLLMELKNMTSMDDMNKNDLVAAFMCALMGMENKYRKTFQDTNNIKSIDIRQLGLRGKIRY